MRGRSRTLCPPLVSLPFLYLLFLEVVAADVVPYLKPGFSFEYESSQVPITEQCETVHLKWARGNAEGPAPIAPYFFQVFSSSTSKPLVVPSGHGPTFDWTVPFPPDTQYQICMYDSFGVSGGCQGMRTVTQPVSNTTCQDVTPSEPLGVTLSPLSRPGVTSPALQPLQCSDISVQPQGGSPPYMLTVSPSMHPPVNITSTNRDPIAWTVALPEGFPFFLSLASDDGSSWSKGPYYVLPSSSTSCLSGSSIAKSTLATSAAGSGAGGLVLGIAIGAVATWFFLRRRANFKRHPKRDSSLPSKPELINDPPSRPITPPRTPETSHFSFRSNSRSRNTDVMEPFTDITPDASPAHTSMHFPMDDKRRMMERGSYTPSHERAPSFTTLASSSHNTTISSAGSNAPLLRTSPSNASASTGRHMSRSISATGSQASRRLTRAPTYTRHPIPQTPSTALSELGYLSSPLSQQQQRESSTTPQSQHRRLDSDENAGVVSPTASRSRPLPRHTHMASERTNMTVSQLIQDDASLIAGNTVDDLPPLYNSQPRETEISVAGGALF
ncbi:hypothetical protein BKA70DRAFT_1528027 [Coprinopsis sp. MPI-PUGE-AT-0042]|nr:hypothetical protein BKA70DRAFT_1528027 [Coprinopsis sp. MPI-PUGE-AT-0042]